MDIGQRVGAIQKTDKDTVFLYGYGVYDGRHELPENMQLYEGQKNQRITLDNGNVVWGMECWWASEDSVKEKIAGRQAVFVDPDR